MNRRKFLNIVGGGTILAAGGAFGFATTRTPHKALAPWEIGAYQDPRKFALAHAILAPNPHNLQPWLIELVGDEEVFIHRDPSRALPETDPFDRQIFIGFGCFVEQMKIAASLRGYDVLTAALPLGKDGPVLAAKFVKGIQADPLAEQILERGCHKTPYDMTPLTPTQISTLSEFATVHTSPAHVAKIRAMTKRAIDIEFYTPRTLKESIDLSRVGKSEINANPDGIEIQSPFLEALRLTGILTNEMMMDTSHSGFKAQAKAYQEMLDATPAYISLDTQSNTPKDQINTGRQWLRLHLKITEMGLSLHPVSQALQEYPEMAKEFQLAHELLAPEGHTVQMLGRLGIGGKRELTPRWSLEERMKNG